MIEFKTDNDSANEVRLQDEPPVKEPPNRPKKPPVEEPEDPSEPPPPPAEPPVKEPPNEPEKPPVKEPPPKDPDREPPRKPPMKVQRFSVPGLKVLCFYLPFIIEPVNPER
jgi:hypothetical protein